MVHYGKKFISILKNLKMDENTSNSALNCWLENYFDNIKITPLSNDASLRRYFRIEHVRTNNADRNINNTYVVVDCSLKKSMLLNFIKVQKLLRAKRISVPKIYKLDTKLGFSILEDLGDKTFLQMQKINNTPKLDDYRCAITTLIDLQKITAAAIVKNYTKKVLLTEMQLFIAWYLVKYKNYELDANSRQKLENIFNYLSKNIIKQKQVFTHRDYHSRNIMVCGGGATRKKLVLIDFQDALIGAYTYDLCSLLKDAYIKLPAKILKTLLSEYYHKAKFALELDVDYKNYLRDFDLTSIQRQLKVLGIFARLSLRDNKNKYLANMPIVFNYVLETSKKYPELKYLHQLLCKL